jgi:predicted Rdx family selenoprotein
MLLKVPVMALKCCKVICSLFILLLLPSIHSLAQIEISKPWIEVVDDKMIISYEINGNASEDTINISLNITDSLGNKIEPKTLEGDIGKNIETGSDKKIIWDLKVDSFYVNMKIYIGIVADVIKPPEIIVPAVENKLTETVSEPLVENKLTDTVNEPEVKGNLAETANHQETEENKEAVTDKPDNLIKEAESTDNASHFSVGKIAMLSAILPGWGLTKLSHKKPYWILGVAGAGCIATSVYYNQLACLNYDKYVETDDVGKMNTYYNDAEKQQKMSNYLAISAVAIWIADLGVASLRAANLNRKARSAGNYITMDCRYDAALDSPMLSFIYKF